MEKLREVGRGSETRSRPATVANPQQRQLLTPLPKKLTLSQPPFWDSCPFQEIESDNYYDDILDSDLIITEALRLIFDHVAIKWTDYILGMHKYVATREEKIYSDTANDSRATLVWDISKQLLHADRLLKFHTLLIEDVQLAIASILDSGAVEADWLRASSQDFVRLSSEVEETLVKPVAQMLDLMYKSISIRDSRQSIELNTSLWRLSWITFIFLPLGFLSAFGMNVSVFSSEPSLKWYFVVAAPLMVLVLLTLMTKNLLRKPSDGRSASPVKQKGV